MADAPRILEDDSIIQKVFEGNLLKIYSEDLLRR